MEVKNSGLFGRDGNMPELVAEPELAKAAFAVPAVDGKWLDEAFRVLDGAVLVRLASVEAPAEEAWKQAEAEVVSQMMSDRAGMLYQTYIEQLADKAEVKMFNSPLLSKLNEQK